MKIPGLMNNPANYDEPVESIKTIQTHISWVFLTGKFAYKIKKPVNFGFLDFSTVEKRMHFCDKELEINKKLSPDIYLKVIPITRKGLGKNGEVIDFAIKMKELPQANLMSNKIEYITNEHIDQIIDILIKFYKETESRPDMGIDVVRENWKENFDQTKEFIGKTLTSEQFGSIKKFVISFMDSNNDLLYRKDKIKWCHGDLHSGNIFVGDKIHIFDAIEFNERFACSDVANDIAFLAMDLDFRGRKDLSEYLVEKFIEKSNDPDIMKLLNFYKIYRAYVRGKVISFKLNDSSISYEEKVNASKEAKKYFEYCMNLI